MLKNRLWVYSKDLVEVFASVAKLGMEHVLVVHGADGLDEIAITEKTYVELKDGDIKNLRLFLKILVCNEPCLNK